LQGKWIVELAELARVNRSTIEVVKSFISRQVDRYRPPWGRFSQDFPRSCVFVATTNEDAPLQDSENRRYLPVRIGGQDADIAAIEAARDQLWAEAVHRYKAGERWWITAEKLGEEAMSQAETARAVDAWEDILAGELVSMDKTTVVEAAGMLCITRDKLGKSEQVRIGNALKKLGFERKREAPPLRAWYYERTSVPTPVPT
jgi:predicted P-loop ATPase